ncbi:MAG: hypothetical protein JRN13_03060 [Nitrososphaerota archaeon]|nr:hypothetical protein [Nitrososphaerota archaeon]MDG6971219.1 hypothetical protein [Nitrososphaerota archaeon]MDG6972301.1 hypothetical protein [Nitrososphaerota archaeon]MDG6973988.1 hypothetical protein [Nitrososphaerota archaeon]MDG6986962.1 hypothetical protein [Nitrososphaerota archaeon]
MMDFCSYLEMLPNDALAHMRKNDVYKVLDGYVAWMLKDKFAPNSLRNRLSAVKQFLAINDFELDNAKMRVKVDLPRYHAVTTDRVPTQEELRSVLTHTDVRGKALVTMLASSGMRVGEFLTLRVKDVDKLDLSSIKDEDFQKMVREKLLGAMANNGSRQKVIHTGEVERYIQHGWEYVASLSDDRAILKLPF